LIRHLGGQPERKKKKLMTLIVGIICKDGIVVASDSQTTAEDRTKNCRTKK
jgi:20S proteasome alpha/beta subunit